MPAPRPIGRGDAGCGPARRLLSLALLSLLLAAMALTPGRGACPRACPDYCELRVLADGTAVSEPPAGVDAGSEPLYAARQPGVGIFSGSNPPQTQTNDFVRWPAAAANASPSRASFALAKHTLQGVTVYVLRLDNPIGHFSVLPPGGQACPGVAHTSATAKAGGCLFATNAGFFNREDEECVGNIISNGHRVQVSGLDNVNFGLTATGDFVVGYLTQEAVSRNSLNFAQLVSGMLWLVRDGEAYHCPAYGRELPHGWFLDQPAARTAIGHDREGRLYIVSSERASTRVGLTIPALTDLLLDLGIHNAVNLDGGGSTTIWTPTEGIVNRLQDPCSEEEGGKTGGPQGDGLCERLVTSILCIK
ncbi:hypothetical protein H696_02011 [Fonticula alba]|uniref:Phosphodiester glycosidase domain-containing protein n=1 Tax=Fonticula alba TaxID=691883 RepID=A0A058ZAU9_FONAL|nr:hypothetical protein H696_02011 [Fonticula alba]KCV71061.1 hypothetical protein H696_02011 [Fonticula alba]|eukprot:XP_009494184.1 hypothetical protein H696_02011 [Fonticula alba]